ncbi:MAG: hypothetical protein M1322_01400 [Candidatus Parvarchaeota archaeon]|jgi:hypothetical protein|nr:hypothetical protein [Candidatus Parvarchaeota archaeon]
METQEKSLYESAMLLLEDSYNKKTGYLNDEGGYSTIIKGNSFRFKIEYSTDKVRYAHNPNKHTQRNGLQIKSPHVNIYVMKPITRQVDYLYETKPPGSPSFYKSAMHPKRRQNSKRWEEDLLGEAKNVYQELQPANQKIAGISDSSNNPIKTQEEPLCDLIYEYRKNKDNLDDLLNKDRYMNVQNLYENAMKFVKASCAKKEGHLTEIREPEFHNSGYYKKEVVGSRYTVKKKNKSSMIKILYEQTDFRFNMSITNWRGKTLLSDYHGEATYKPGRWEELLIQDSDYVKQHSNVMHVKYPLVNRIKDSRLGKITTGLSGGIAGAAYGIYYSFQHWPVQTSDVFSTLGYFFLVAAFFGLPILVMSAIGGEPNGDGS